MRRRWNDVERLNDFFFQISFSVDDEGLAENFVTLLESELADLAKPGGRIDGLELARDDQQKITISFHARDFTSFKVGTSSITRYLEIIGKSADLVP